MIKTLSDSYLALIINYWVSLQVCSWALQQPNLQAKFQYPLAIIKKSGILKTRCRVREFHTTLCIHRLSGTRYF